MVTLARDVAQALIDAGYVGARRDGNAVAGIPGWRIACEPVRSSEVVADRLEDEILAYPLDYIAVVHGTSDRCVAMAEVQLLAAVNAIVNAGGPLKQTRNLLCGGRSRAYGARGNPYRARLPLVGWLGLMVGWHMFVHGRRGRHCIDVHPLQVASNGFSAAPAVDERRLRVVDYNEYRMAQVFAETRWELSRYGRLVMSSTAGFATMAVEEDGGNTDVIPIHGGAARNFGRKVQGRGGKRHGG